jgi:hypothetical protein
VVAATSSAKDPVALAPAEQHVETFVARREAQLVAAQIAHDGAQVARSVVAG